MRHRSTVLTQMRFCVLSDDKQPTLRLVHSNRPLWGRHLQRPGCRGWDRPRTCQRSRHESMLRQTAERNAQQPDGPERCQCDEAYVNRADTIWQQLNSIECDAHRCTAICPNELQRFRLELCTYTLKAMAKVFERPSHLPSRSCRWRQAVLRSDYSIADHITRQERNYRIAWTRRQRQNQHVDKQSMEKRGRKCIALVFHKPLNASRSWVYADSSGTGNTPA